ncbi:hypothetical protein Dda_0562 [Drechslerella dactyloides]|uniref:Uncharacterized protein n=1 Tax=Drechslerella dactyloides TaxID=74499 RepID=A0AAD6NM41_DREDA|nr:hypothetical protein Dda_0562 [Drechslerella dactyloides]
MPIDGTFKIPGRRYNHIPDMANKLRVGAWCSRTDDDSGTGPRRLAVPTILHAPFKPPRVTLHVATTEGRRPRLTRSADEMNRSGDFGMPGRFPDDPSPRKTSDSGGSPQTSGTTVSTPQSRTWKDVVEELSQKKALRDCIPFADPHDTPGLEVLDAEILSLREELDRLAMEQQDDPLFSEHYQRLMTYDDLVPQTFSDSYRASPVPGGDAVRKRGYSQVDHSAEEAESRRQLARPSTHTAAYAMPGSLTPYQDSSDYWATTPQWAAADTGEPSNIDFSAPQGQLVSRDKPPVGAPHNFEVIDLTADDDDLSLVSGDQTQYRSRVKIHSRNSARRFGDWSGVKQEEIQLVNLDMYQALNYHGLPQGQPFRQANFEDPIVIDDDEPYWPPNFAPQPSMAFPYAQNQPQDHLAYGIQALKAEEQDQVTKILEHLVEDTENKRPDDRLQTPPELNVSLMEHQKIGLTWLVKQEESNNRGGILADDMGLGKTIQAIALMLHRPSDTPNQKTTLIVCPVSLMAQWQREIQERVKAPYALNTYIYHGQQPKKFKDFNALKQYDVILTSYGTLAGEFKKKQAAQERLRTTFTPTEYPFFSSESKWYRVILDESQHVKNHRTLTSRACAGLAAKYRICLSGTPMQNSIDDLFGAVRFLRIPRYHEYRNWSTDFSSMLRLKGGFRQEAMQRLHALIKAIMLRRKKDSLIDGKPLLVLPAKTIEVIHPVFSEDELVLYQAVEGKISLRFNKYLETGAVSKHYTYILLLLLRLRQMCCHPRMINDLSVKITDEEKTRQEGLMAELTPEVIERLKVMGINGCPICFEPDQSLQIILPCGHEICQECLTGMINQAQANAMAAGEDGRALLCPHCRGPLDPSRMIDWHVFRSVHLPEENDLAGDLDKELNNALGGDISSDDSESGSEDESSDEDSDLGGFIVDDDETVSEAGSDDKTDDELENSQKNASAIEITLNRRIKREPDLGLEIGEDTEDSFADSAASGSSRFDEKLKAEDTDGDELHNLTESDSDDEDILKFIRGEGADIKREKTTTDNNRIGSDSDDKFLKGEETDIKRTKKITAENKKAKDKGKKRAKTKTQKKKKPNKGKKNKGKKVKKEEDSKRGNSLSDNRRRSLYNKRARSKYFRELAKNWTTSAKIEKVREILDTIRKNDPTEKTIVFSSFTSFLDLLQIPLQREDGIAFERYDGSMSAKERNDAVLKFGSSRNVNVMLISLKAGNSGLNMMAASQVIIIEPWWNPFVEEQAIDRAHRFGQLRPVKVHRLIIQDTVESRIMELQDLKREIISQAMDEQARKNISKLSIRDLVYLFTGRRDS